MVTAQASSTPPTSYHAIEDLRRDPVSDADIFAKYGGRRLTKAEMVGHKGYRSAILFADGSALADQDHPPRHAVCLTAEQWKL